jgi:hypothetical protein
MENSLFDGSFGDRTLQAAEKLEVLCELAEGVPPLLYRLRKNPGFFSQSPL